MQARKPVNEPFLNRTVSAGLTLPAVPEPYRAAAPAGAASRPGRPCMFCRYRRAGAEQREAAHA